MFDILLNNFNLYECKKNYTVNGFSYNLTDYIISIGQLKANSGTSCGLILDINYFPIVEEEIVESFILELKNRFAPLFKNGFVLAYIENAEGRQTLYGQEYLLSVRSLLNSYMS